ncbi:unnamed protein product [Closterium sp. NIES-54]
MLHCPAARTPCSPRAALPCSPRAALPLQPARCPALQPVRCPAIVAASSGGQQQQQCQANTLLPQQLCEWVIQRDRPGGGDYGVMRAGGTGQQRQSRRQETLSPQ